MKVLREEKSDNQCETTSDINALKDKVTTILPEQKDNDDNINDNKEKMIMLMSKFPGQDSDGLPEHSCSRSREKEGWTRKEVNLHTLYIQIDLQGYPKITLLGTLKNKSK